MNLAATSKHHSKKHSANAVSAGISAVSAVKLSYKKPCGKCLWEKNSPWKNARGEKMTRGKMRAGKYYPAEQCVRVPRFIFLPARISAGPRVLLRVNPVTVPLLNWACFRYLKHHNNRTYRSSLVMPSTNFSIFIYFKNIYYFIWFNFFINLIFYIIVEILVWLKVNLGVHKMLNAAKYVLITFVTLPHKTFCMQWAIHCGKSPVENPLAHIIGFRLLGETSILTGGDL